MSGQHPQQPAPAKGAGPNRDRQQLRRHGETAAAAHSALERHPPAAPTTPTCSARVHNTRGHTRGHTRGQGDATRCGYPQHARDARPTAPVAAARGQKPPSLSIAASTHQNDQEVGEDVLEVDEEVDGVLQVVVLAHFVLVDHLLRVVRNVGREEREAAVELEAVE